MKNSNIVSLVVGFLLCFYSISIFAGQITTTGAEAGANSTGEITAFVGKKGLICPADFKPGDYVANPYKGEKVLYRIDYSNIAQYEKRLSPGQIARIKRNKKFYLNVYPTHRNFVFPKVFLTATVKNQKTAKINRANMLKGFNGGIPFPVPENGIQAIWNIKKQFSGDDVVKTETRRVVSPSGRIRKEIQYTRVINLDENRLFSKIDNNDKAARKILSLYTYPADKAGTGMLITNYINDRRPDAQWLYIPALRRVRRAPTMSRGAQIDGESTLDEFGYFFRGPVDDWKWKLLGKREMYIPVNAYGMWKVDRPDKEECPAGDINPKSLRYELRRVWAVEGTAKKGLDHPYSKRTFYADEDNWYATVGEVYDKRGNLWRMSEFYIYLDYCQDNRTVVSMIYLNLDSGRYELLGGGRTKSTKTIILNSGMKNSDFTVQALRRSGR